MPQRMSRRQLLVVIGGVALGAGATAVTLGRPRSAAPATARPPTLKSTITGVMTRDVSSEATSRLSDLGGVVAEVYWGLVQPAQGGAIDTSNGVSHSWAEVIAAKASGLPYRVRLQTGVRAPAWALDLNGEGLWFLWNYNDDPYSKPVPRWWEQAYREAVDDFVRKVAALLESDPLCRDVVVCYASKFYTEPFIMFPADKTKAPGGIAGPDPAVYPTGYPAGSVSNAGKSNIQMYYEAGLRCQTDGSGNVIGLDPRDIDALTHYTQINSATGNTYWHDLGWTTTRYALAVNPGQTWKIISTNPFTYTINVDTSPFGWTNQTQSKLKSTMGNALMLGNCSLRAPITSGARGGYPQMYAHQTELGGAVFYQTATRRRDLAALQNILPTGTNAQAIAATLDCGSGIDTISNQPYQYLFPPMTQMTGRCIEMYTGWSPDLSSAQCAAYNARMTNNPAGIQRPHLAVSPDRSRVVI